MKRNDFMGKRCEEAKRNALMKTINFYEYLADFNLLAESVISKMEEDAVRETPTQLKKIMKTTRETINTNQDSELQNQQTKVNEKYLPAFTPTEFKKQIKRRFLMSQPEQVRISSIKTKSMTLQERDTIPRLSKPKIHNNFIVRKSKINETCYDLRGRRIPAKNRSLVKQTMQAFGNKVEFMPSLRQRRPSISPWQTDLYGDQ